MIEQEKKPRMKGGLLAGKHSLPKRGVGAYDRLYGFGKDLVIHRGYCGSSFRRPKSQDYPCSSSPRFT